MTNERIAQVAAGYKKTARDLFEKAVADLVELAFRYSNLGANFLWDADPVLDAEANRILRGLSDEAARKAKELAMKLIEEANWADGEDAWEETENGDDRDILFLFDQQGSFLKELLEIWIALAFVNGMTQNYLRITLLRYLSNPYAAPMWRGLPAGLLKWGRGYQRDIIAQIALIGQDAIINTARYAEWMDASENGATYYIRRRGSNYDCPQCDEECGIPIPISVPFSESHPRCMCWPEYHFDEI